MVIKLECTSRGDRLSYRNNGYTKPLINTPLIQDIKGQHARALYAKLTWFYKNTGAVFAYVTEF